MVKYFGLHNSRGKDQVSGYLLVTPAGLRVTRWMVMDKNEAGSVVFYGAFHDLAGRDGTAIYGASKEVSGVNNLVLAVQKGILKTSFFEPRIVW